MTNVNININAMYKEYIDGMPAVLETKKDIGEYEKEFWKNNKDKVKELKAKAKADAKAEAKAAKPSKRKKVVDEDGNVKTRAPTAYNIYYKEQRPLVKEAHPEFDNKEIMKEVARLWQIKKDGGIVDVVDVKEKSASFKDAEEDLDDDDDEDDEDNYYEMREDEEESDEDEGEAQNVGNQ
jgi:hypothetical protein